MGRTCGGKNGSPLSCDGGCKSSALWEVAAAVRLKRTWSQTLHKTNSSELVFTPIIIAG